MPKGRGMRGNYYKAFAGRELVRSFIFLHRKARLVVEDTVKSLLKNVKKAIDGMKIIKEIVVPKKLVNLVVKP